jgi:hypothetical protein
MTDLDKLIANKIRRWPTLYRCRTDVLHAWFCMNGNGLDWENGELDSFDEEPSLQDHIRKEERNNREMISKYPSIDGPDYQVSCAKRIAEITFRYENADKLALVNWDKHILMDRVPPKPIYPLCEYAAMCNVPNDVKPEWLAAVREMIFVIFAFDPQTCVEYQMHPKRYNHSQTVEMADKCLQDLAARFGSNEPSSLAEWQVKMDITNHFWKKYLEAGHI